MFVYLPLIFIHEKQIVDILQKVIDSIQGRPRSQGQASFRYKHVTSTMGKKEWHATDISRRRPLNSYL